MNGSFLDRCGEARDRQGGDCLRSRFRAPDVVYGALHRFYLGAMMGDRRVPSLFYGSFMDDNIVKQVGVVAERSEIAVFVLRHHTRINAIQVGSVYSTRCSAANAVYREDQ
jgi:hypothetical protein